MKKCPKCGSTLFKAMVEYPAIVDFSGENGEVVVKKKSDKFRVRVVMCANKECKEHLTEEQLVDEVKCAGCGKVFDEKELIDGLCEECYLKKNRPDLAKMSEAELVKRILELEKKSGAAPKVDKIEEKVTKAEETVKEVQEKAEEVKEEEKVDKPKTSRSRSKKKKDDKEKEAAAEEVKDDPIPIPEDQDELMDDIPETPSDNDLSL